MSLLAVPEFQIKNPKAGPRACKSDGQFKPVTNDGLV